MIGGMWGLPFLGRMFRTPDNEPLTQTEQILIDHLGRLTAQSVKFDWMQCVLQVDNNYRHTYAFRYGPIGVTPFSSLPIPLYVTEILIILPTPHADWSPAKLNRVLQREVFPVTKKGRLA